MMDVTALPTLAEGKTKRIYANPDNPRTVHMYFKDDITAGDGLKHDVMAGKAVLDWRINRDVFEYLNRQGIRTHYVASPAERVTLVKRLDCNLNLEVVSRRIAAGSMLKWGHVAAGTRYEPVITQMHYKDDRLHDPMLDDGYIEYLIQCKGAVEYAEMRAMNAAVFVIVERAFAQFGVQLVDVKLEYGVIDGHVQVIDEIAGGSLRLWPYQHAQPELNQPNVLRELDTEGRLDKDTYRMGEPFDAVLTGFRQIAAITAQFKALP